MNNKVFAAAALGLVIVIGVLSFIGSQENLQGRFVRPAADPATRYPSLNEAPVETLLSIRSDALATEVTIKETDPVKAAIGRWELEFMEGGALSSFLCTHYEFLLRKGENSLYLASIFEDAELLLEDENGLEIGRWSPNFNSSLSSFGGGEEAEPQPASGKYNLTLSATPKTKGIASYLTLDGVDLVSYCDTPAAASSGVKIKILH